MNWKRWKIGLAVACLTGILTALIGLAAIDVFTWKVILFLVGITAKDMLLFLKDHPVEKIIDLDDVPQPGPGSFIYDRAVANAGVPPVDAQPAPAPLPPSEPEPTQPENQQTT